MRCRPSCSVTGSAWSSSASRVRPCGGPTLGWRSPGRPRSASRTRTRPSRTSHVGELMIGIDVGGTNTDAVLIDGSGNVLARTKVPTTQDPIDGIASAMSAVRPARDRVALVALGTTHAVNAIVQRRDLRRVTLIRIGAPGTEAVPPHAGWPEDPVRAAVARTAVVRGGVEVDGVEVDGVEVDGVEVDGRVLPVDEEEVRRFVGAVDPDAIAIVGTLSPLLPDQELKARELISGASSAPVTMGHEVAGRGRLELENAA